MDLTVMGNIQVDVVQAGHGRDLLLLHSLLEKPRELAELVVQFPG